MSYISATLAVQHFVYLLCASSVIIISALCFKKSDTLLFSRLLCFVDAFSFCQCFSIFLTAYSDKKPSTLCQEIV